MYFRLDHKQIPRAINANVFSSPRPRRKCCGAVDYASHSDKLGKGSGCQSLLACIKFQISDSASNGSAQLTKTHASSTVHDSIEIIRRPSWRRAEPRWQRGDLAATTTDVALKLINGGWRVAPLRHSSRTNNDRPYMSTLPGMSAEDPRCVPEEDEPEVEIPKAQTRVEPDAPLQTNNAAIKHTKYKEHECQPQSRLDLYHDGLSPAQLLVGVDGDPVTVDADAPLAVPLRVAEEVIQRPPPAVPGPAGFGIAVVDLAVLPGGVGPAPEQVWRREGLRLVVLRQTMVEGRSGSVRGRGGWVVGRGGGGGGGGVGGGGGGGEGMAVGERDVISAEVGVGVVLLEVVPVEFDGPDGGGAGERHGWVAASRTQEVEGGFGSAATTTIIQ
ncbi:hypothetical protein BHE74_00045707 [Ensete ventricosum]|nr:hypothetical protein BHE74_00045707 [Ensete ventricosum]